MRFYVLYIADGCDVEPPADFWLIGPFGDGDAAVAWCEAHVGSGNWYPVRFDPGKLVHVEDPDAVPCRTEMVGALEWHRARSAN